MRMMHRQNGAMVKVVGLRGEKIVIIHPANGKPVEAPRNLYISPPRCVAEREARRDRAKRAMMASMAAALERRKAEENALKAKVGRGEIQSIIYKDVVFPLIGDWTVVRLMMELKGLSKKEKRGSMKKKIVAEMLRRCKHWHVNEVLGTVDGTVA
jgi:hypothetical protein